MALLLIQILNNDSFMFLELLSKPPRYHSETDTSVNLQENGRDCKARGAIFHYSCLLSDT